MTRSYSGFDLHHAAMPLTALNLGQWTRRIRTQLTPALNNPLLSPTAVLSPTILEELRLFFRALHETDVTPALLEATHVHRALLEIAEPGGGWPEGLARHAESQLALWETMLAEVEPPGGRLWAEGGRMHGCRLVAGAEACASLMRDCGLRAGFGRREWWAVEGGHAEALALQVGHVGFRVGEYGTCLPSHALRPPFPVRDAS